jgi:outer membrane putative beta-barrel porin/alpha-amylase
MSKLKAATLVSVLLLLISTSSVAQGPCPTSTSTDPNAPLLQRSGDLVCSIPQVYGPGGLVGINKNGPLLPTDTLVNKPHEVHFQAGSLESFTPLNAEIGTQLSQLPLTSPASGFIFSFNPALGVVSRTTESFGPILTERAETIGKHKLFVGVSYQFFDFNKVDGVNLKKFGTVFEHEDVPPCKGTLTSTGCNPLLPNNGDPLLENDIVDTANNISLKVHQITAVATFGLTDRLDVSVAVPILDVRMGVSSDATIFSFEPADPVNIPDGNHQDHQFVDPAPGINVGHETVIAPDHALFYTARSASGIGDVIFRGKFQVLKKEKAGLAVGLDLHAPTGDEKNFLGSGAWGARPFVAFSYAGRIEPRATFGYQRNGDSILAGNITTFTKDHLPDVLTYSFGADAGITRRFSVSGDFIGQSLLSAKKIVSQTFTDHAGTPHDTIVTSGKQTINQASVAVGGKVNPIGKLLVTLNVLFRVNDAGLHSKPAPLVGVSYTF